LNILLTGGLGVNGAWVTRQLLFEGHRPIVYENRADTVLISDIVNKLDIVAGDILDIANIVRVLKKYEVNRIIHLAALMPGEAQANPLMGFKVNALGTVSVLEAARIMEIERVVFTSSKAVLSPATGEYGYPTYKPIDESYPTYPSNSPLMVYGTTKIASEQMGINYSQDYGIEFISLRFATIYGIGKSARHGKIAIHSKMIENALVGKPTYIPYGGNERDDMLYSKDCANAIVLACFAKNVKHRIFHIGTGKVQTLGDLAESIRKVCPGAVFDIQPGLDYMDMPGVYCAMNFSRAKEEIGYTPRFDIDQGVKDYVESMRHLDIKPIYRP
jgi:UDP-glucose 4-epimerase